MRFLNWGPFPPLSTQIDIDVIHMRKMDQVYMYPLHFCILQVIKNWMVRRPGNEAKISVPHASQNYLQVLVKQHNICKCNNPMFPKLLLEAQKGEAIWMNKQNEHII